MERLASTNRSSKALSNIVTHQVPSEPILSSKHSMLHYISFEKFDPSHKRFAFNLSLVKEPTFYHQAVHDPKWIDIMNKQLDAFEANNTWSLVV